MAYSKTGVQPAWWSDTHTSAWDRTKAAFKRDWEQTKSDFGSKSARDLNQDAGDTMRQAAGKQHIPMGANVPDEADMKRHAKQAEKEAKKEARQVEKQVTGNRTWDEVEGPIRFGYGASQYYNESWDDNFERNLAREWKGLNADQPWEDVGDYVKFGWERGRMQRKP